MELLSRRAMSTATTADLTDISTQLKELLNCVHEHLRHCSNSNEKHKCNDVKRMIGIERLLQRQLDKIGEVDKEREKQAADLHEHQLRELRDVPMKCIELLMETNKKLEQELAQLKVELVQARADERTRLNYMWELQNKMLEIAQGAMLPRGMDDQAAHNLAPDGLLSHASQTAVSQANEMSIQENQQLTEMKDKLRGLIGCLEVRMDREDCSKLLLVEKQKEIERLKQDVEEAKAKLQRNEAIARMTSVRALQEKHQEEDPKIKGEADVVLTAEQVELEHFHRLQNNYIHLSDKLMAGKVSNRMFQQGSLTLKEFEGIKGCSTGCGEAETLLDIVMKSGVEIYESFLECLRSTDQIDVFKCIVCDDYSQEIDHAQLIRQHYIFLLDQIDVKMSGLADQMFQDLVLDMKEMNDINEEPLSSRAVEKLLSLMSRKTVEQWNRFLDALDKTRQSHVRNVITGVLDAGVVERAQPSAVRQQAMDEKLYNEISTIVELQQRVKQLMLQLKTLEENLQSEKQQTLRLEVELAMERQTVDNTMEKLQSEELATFDLRRRLNGLEENHSKEMEALRVQAASEKEKLVEDFQLEQQKMIEQRIQEHDLRRKIGLDLAEQGERIFKRHGVRPRTFF